MKTIPDNTVLQSCGFNCGSRCQLRLHAEDGQVAWVESDTGPDAPDAPQMRACLCGRAWGHWVNSPHRLDYPLKRVGPRGSGQFQRISWDEALDEIAAQIKRITADFGPEAIFFPYASGILASGQSPLERAIDCYGGHLRLYSDYSSAQLQAGTMALFGDDGYYSGSPLEEAANSDVLVLFGSSMFATRQGGAAGGHYLNQLREQAAAEGRPFKVVSIDPRHTPEVRGAQDQWIPLRPGTDAAFVAAVIHELLIDGLADEELLRSHCVGFFEDTLPPGTPPHSSYSDYVLGRGPDGTEKTCAWAAAITGCPAATIRQFARTLAQAKSAFITKDGGRSAASTASRPAAPYASWRWPAATSDAPAPTAASMSRCAPTPPRCRAAGRTPCAPHCRRSCGPSACKGAASLRPKGCEAPSSCPSPSR